MKISLFTMLDLWRNTLTFSVLVRVKIDATIESKSHASSGGPKGGPYIHLNCVMIYIYDVC